MMIDIVEEARRIEDDLIKWRRDLHRIPELGLELEETSNYLAKELDRMGIEYKRMLGGSAIIGLIRGRGPGKTLGLRADMDGLAIAEKTGLDFASKNGNMHACGHDGHMAILLGAAKILKENENLFPGNIKLIFQPGEEFPGGAKYLVEEGVLEDPKLDGILGLHNGQLSDELEHGQIGIKYDEMMASMDRVFIRVKGRGGHGAYPEEAIDPIPIGAEIVLAIQNIRSREISSAERAVISLCRLEAGSNQNIIPDSLEIEGTIRTFNNDLRKYIARRIEEIVAGISRANRADYDYEYEFKYPVLINDNEFTNSFLESALEIMEEDKIVELKKPLMGAEDMAYYLEEVAGTFFYMSNIAPIDGVKYPHHNSRFDLDESLFYQGVALMVNHSLNFLNSN